ncbi:hypothetical protein [Curtobacterium sp. VKM Ac-2922]|uniref:hypothetical protein n=1 Tax=Curtobacterium sp. VKM Ac-2922 TaxID=2929475 RepID=UPI001FB526B0|nr:hypothetical protein [Curtobacterium sp. VKM Ac-2922]MCJ1713410.1 hypothetical protein [Curtobacterium sp. VKM Ac-2922]
MGLIAVIACGVSTAACAGRTAQPQPEGTSPTNAASAKQKVIDTVSAVTERLGGVWTTRSGPGYTQICQLPNGESGAHWVNLVANAEGGDPEPDAAATTALWKSQGMTVERWADPDGPGIVGRRRDSVESISLYASPRNYTVQAVSLCFRGDADRL